MGIIPTSSFDSASWRSSLVDRVSECFPRIISRPTPKSRMPPAILKAGMVMLKKLKMNEPARPNELSTRRQVSAARSAVAPCSALVCAPTRPKKTGTAANGSTIEKSDPKQTIV